MRNKRIWNKKKLIQVYKRICKLEKRQITKDEWNERRDCPSDTPVKSCFGSWNNFVKICGFEPYIPHFPRSAILNHHIYARGGKGNRWKGGRFKDKNGYVHLWKPDYPFSRPSGYIHEHRYVMSEHLNRELKDTENIHHINGIRDDNRLENLELWMTKQPIGQRVEDVIKYYIDFLSENGYKVIKLKNKKVKTKQLIDGEAKFETDASRIERETREEKQRVWLENRDKILNQELRLKSQKGIKKKSTSAA